MSDWIASMIESWGAAGVALLMFLETVFPPIPSEVVLPLAGFQGGEGHINPILALLAGTAGAVAGCTLWYLAGCWVGLDRLKEFARRHGRLLTLTPGDIDKVDRWFDRHGGKAVLLGRMVPGIRTLISVPAGIAGMSLRRFLALTTIGTLAWSGMLFGLGWWLGARFHQVSEWMGPVSDAIIFSVVAVYLYRVIFFNSRVRRGR